MKQKNKIAILLTVVVVIIVSTFTFTKVGGLQGKLTLKNNISRGEFSKILAESLASAKGEDVNSILSYTNCTMFSDVKITDSYGPSICYLHVNNIVTGNSDGTFNPSGIINRAEIVKLIMLVYKNIKYPNIPNMNVYTGQAYKDVVENEWYYTWIQEAASLGITDVKPFKNLKFYPGNSMTSGRAQNMINNLNKLLNLSI